MSNPQTINENHREIEKISALDLNSLGIPYGRRGGRGVLDTILVLVTPTLRVSHSRYKFKTLFSDMIVGECVEKHSRCI